VLARSCAEIARRAIEIRAAFGRRKGIASEPREKLGQTRRKLPICLIRPRPEKACSIMISIKDR